MNDTRYKWMLYVITIVILATIGIQAYWNYKNYLNNKQQLINDVQISLDNAVDTYYTNLAENSTVGFAIDASSSDNIFKKKGELSKVINKIELLEKGEINIDSINKNSIKGITIYSGAGVDSVLDGLHSTHRKSPEENIIASKEWIKKNSTKDSTKNWGIKMLTAKIVTSITTDSLQLQRLDSLLQNEFSRKSINLNASLEFKDEKGSVFKTNEIKNKESALNTSSKSSLLPNKSELKVYFTNETKEILKRIFSGILISTLLVLAVISCLFYLLKVINNQKQLAEVKNDLISNITHEFKTPIATIGVALESIKNFNVLDDKEKTKTYLDMSSSQLSKLNIMVEKLLETATLDSENLNLKKDNYNITDVLNTIVEKHKMQTEKSIDFITNTHDIFAHVDIFHFENAVNNILDNAIKYGGDKISINTNQNSSSFTISISDNGNTLKKANKDKIFEKFYRIPKGNTHDVKGFGIGLYYVKKITEKHGGAIQLDIANQLTTFKISLPNE